MALQGQGAIERETELRDRIDKLERMLVQIVNDASPMTAGCSRMVDEGLIEKAAKMVGINYE